MLSRRLPLLLFLITAVFMPEAGSASRVTIHDIRLWRAPDSTRVVFDLDGAAQHSMQVLENPSRVVMSVPGGVLATNPNKLSFQGTPIKSLRTIPQANGDLLMVLDLSEAVKPKSFFLKKNPPMDDRLVLDLVDLVPHAEDDEPDDIDAVVGAPVQRPLQAAQMGGAAASASDNKPGDKPQPLTAPASSASATIKQASAPVRSADLGGKRKLIIAIDAGHGGEDPGAIGPDGIREKDVVLQIARKLQENINRELGYKAVLVRKSDYYVGLSQRRDIARKASADLFVSIHADAFTRPQANGSSVYALSSKGATSASAQFLADSENQSDLVGGVSLDDKDAVLSSVLVDLSMTYKMEASLDVGSTVLRKMANISRLHSNKVEQAAFAVLKTPDIPSILVETGFISNKAEARKLSHPAYQQKMADSIFKGIHEYFLRKAPEGSYIASIKHQYAVDSYHRVAKGETLSEIAKRYGISMATIASYNKLQSNEVKIGQELRIPARR